MITKSLDQTITEFIRFRKNMGLNLSLEKARYIWGRGSIENLESNTRKRIEKSSKRTKSLIIQNKLKIAENNLKNLLVLDWVRFIGVSGSIAAGFAKENDDIDVFIVVRDGCGWIYRGILTIKNILKHTNRTKRDGENVKDLFCVNYIVEERGLNMKADIFNMHELMYLIPIYNPSYINYIYKQNLWLVKKFGVNKSLLITRVRRDEKVGLVIQIINFFAYIAQVMFMLIAGHNPELKRLIEGYRKGRIGFFPKGFKEKILKDLKSI